MRFDILTLFPDMVNTVLGESIIGRAQKADIITVRTHQIRDFSADRHRKVDDTPYGGGYGMVMSCQPIYDCYESVPKCDKSRTVYLSPKGRVFNHDVARELTAYDQLILLCGHYEGVDQRVLDEIVDEEISIGDFVLTGGEIPACIVVDAVSRLLEGTLAAPEAYEGESVACGILEYPQYTKPREWRGRTVPDVLLEGDHKKIERYRLECAVEITRERRPDLLTQHPEFVEMLKPKQKKRAKSSHSKQNSDNNSASDVPKENTVSISDTE